MENKSVFITRGPGCVGSVLVNKLLKKYYQRTTLVLRNDEIQGLPGSQNLNVIIGYSYDTKLQRETLKGTNILCT